MPKQAKRTTVKLPTSPNKPSNDILDYSFVFFGEKGVGKSTLAASFPDVTLHMSFEPGRYNLKVPIVPERGQPPLTWVTSKEYLDLAYNEHEPGRIVIDTIDGLSRLCQEYWAQKKKVPSVIGIKDHGRTWDELKSDWYNQLNKMTYAGWRFTFVSHAKNRPQVLRGYSREDLKTMYEEGLIAELTQPSCSGWAFDYVKIPTDFAFYYGYWGPERVLHLRGDESIWSASGLDDHFLQPAKSDHRPKEPLHLIPMGDKSQVFKTLKAAWDNKLEGYFRDDEEDESIF